MTVPYVKNSATSQAAASQFAPQLGRREQEVTDAIRSAGAHGMTTEECELATGLSHQTCSARVSTLADRGLLIKTAVVRTNRSGCKAAVYLVPAFVPSAVGSAA